MEKEKQEIIKQKNNYMIGIIGAILGGVIATIPWILMYVYGNMMLSLLAVLIAAGEFYGYKLFKGKIDSKLPTMIIVLALIIVTIVTLIIIPLMLLGTNGYEINFNTFKNLYSTSNFTTAIIRDYIISLLFTALGASIISSNIKKQLLSNTDNVKLDLVTNPEQEKLKNDGINIIKPIFKKYNAIDNDNTMLKEEVLAELENPNQKIYFNQLKQYGIIQKEKGRYFYNEKNETNSKIAYPYKNIIVITIIIILAIASVCLVFVERENNYEKVWNTDVSYKINNTWELMQEYSEESGWVYYSYLSEETSGIGNVELENGMSEEDIVDYSTYPAMIQLNYETEPSEEKYESIEDLKEKLEEYIANAFVNPQPDIYDTEILKTKNGYDALKIKIGYTSYPLEIQYFYYVMDTDGAIGYITGSTFNAYDEQILEKQLLEIVNSFKWEK